MSFPVRHTLPRLILCFASGHSRSDKGTHSECHPKGTDLSIRQSATGRVGQFWKAEMGTLAKRRRELGQTGIFLAHALRRVGHKLRFLAHFLNAVNRLFTFTFLRWSIAAPAVARGVFPAWRRQPDQNTSRNSDRWPSESIIRFPASEPLGFSCAGSGVAGAGAGFRTMRLIAQPIIPIH